MFPVYTRTRACRCRCTRRSRSAVWRSKGVESPRAITRSIWRSDRAAHSRTRCRSWKNGLYLALHLLKWTSLRDVLSREKVKDVPQSMNPSLLKEETQTQARVCVGGGETRGVPRGGRWVRGAQLSPASGLGWWLVRTPGLVGRRAGVSVTER